MFLVAAAQSVSLNELLDFLAITVGAEDYDDRRKPFMETIRDLCSPFIIFDKPGQGDAPDNPLLKLCHKTVEDFFRQSPDEIDLKTAKLRRYFVTSEQANENIGSSCLAYLQYKRYQKPDIVLSLDSILRKPVPREHAFLAYAATFWAQHLEHVSPTPEIYQAIRRFLQSPAFWTCLAVQTRVGRYLFGRYMGCKSSCQYEMGIRGSRTRGDDCFGLPLPRWLDKYSNEGLQLDRSMCYFVDEWREVLMTYADGLSCCLPLRACEPSCRLAPLEKSRKLRVAHLSEYLPEARSVGGCYLLGVAFIGRALWADLLFQDRTYRGGFQYLRIPLFSAKKKMTSKKVEYPPVSEDLNNWVVNLTNKSIDGTEALEAWKVDPGTLSFHRINHDLSEHYDILPAVFEGVKCPKRGKWDVIYVQEIKKHSQVATGPLRIAHMTWRPREIPSGQGNPLSLEAAAAAAAAAATEDESDDDTDASEDEHDAASSDDSSSEDSRGTESTRSLQSSAGSSNGASAAGAASGADDRLTTDCLLLVPWGGKPFWIPWSAGQRIWSRVLGATHPTLPLVLVTHTARQLEVINVAQGTRTTKHLPEPPDLQEVSLASVRGLCTIFFLIYYRRVRCCYILIWAPTYCRTWVFAVWQIPVLFANVLLPAKSQDRSSNHYVDFQLQCRRRLRRRTGQRKPGARVQV